MTKRESVVTTQMSHTQTIDCVTQVARELTQYPPETVPYYDDIKGLTSSLLLPPHWLCAQKSINAIRRRRRWKRGKGHGRTTSAGRVNESNKPTSHDDLWEPTIFFSFLSCVCGDTSNFTLPPPGSFVCSTAQKSSGNTSVSSFQINNFRLAAPEINNNERRVPLLLLGSSCLFFRPPLQIKKLQYQL